MATGRSYLGRANYRFLSGDRAPAMATEAVFEFEEADVYAGSARSGSPEYWKPIMAAKKASAPAKRSAAEIADRTPASLPVNVPDWSKILRDEYRDNRRRDSLDDDDDLDFGGENRNRVPPHEFLARTRIASFSVHEGIGRTLKGRDLSMVRNAIWKKTGFED